MGHADPVIYQDLAVATSSWRCWDPSWTAVAIRAGMNIAAATKPNVRLCSLWTPKSFTMPALQVAANAPEELQRAFALRSRWGILSSLERPHARSIQDPSRTVRGLPDRTEGKKLEPPLDETLARYIQTKPEEVRPVSGQKRKTARPPPKRKPGGTPD
jgi:hypothetical protein